MTTTTTETTRLSRGDVEFLLEEHRKLTWHGWGWSRVPAREDWHTARVRLTTPDSLDVIEAVRGWLTTVEVRRGTADGPTGGEFAAAASRALQTDVSPGEAIVGCLLAGVPVDLGAGNGIVTVGVNRQSLKGD